MNASIKFADSIDKDSDDTADRLSELLCTYLECEKYEIICDIIKSRMPKPIHLNSFEGGEPVELKSRSEIVYSIKEKARIRVYFHKRLKHKIDRDLIRKYLCESISSW